MSFTLIGKHEKDSRNNRDGYVTAMLDLMEKDSKVMHVDCDLETCINTGKVAMAFQVQKANADFAWSGNRQYHPNLLHCKHNSKRRRCTT